MEVYFTVSVGEKVWGLRWCAHNRRCRLIQVFTVFTSSLCQKPQRARYELARAFDTNRGGGGVGGGRRNDITT